MLNISAQSNIRVLNAKVQALDTAFQQQTFEGLFISDTLGNVILQYPHAEKNEVSW